MAERHQRAYYAAFWRARRYWQETQHQHPLPGDGAVHFEVHDRFARYGDFPRQEIAANLKTLLGLRRKADYVENVPDLRKHASLAIIWAERVLNGISGLDD